MPKTTWKRRNWGTKYLQQLAYWGLINQWLHWQHHWQSASLWSSPSQFAMLCNVHLLCVSCNLDTIPITLVGSKLHELQSQHDIHDVMNFYFYFFHLKKPSSRSPKGQSVCLIRNLHLYLSAFGWYRTTLACPSTMGVCDPKPALNSFSLPQPNWATIKTSQYIYKSGAWDYDVLVINCSASMHTKCFHNLQDLHALGKARITEPNHLAFDSPAFNSRQSLHYSSP